MKKIQLNAFNVLLNSLNSVLEIMNKSGFRIYDNENKDFYISSVAYDKNVDELEFIVDQDPVMEKKLGEPLE